MLNTSPNRVSEILNRVHGVGRPIASVLLSLGFGFIGLPSTLAYSQTESAVREAATETVSQVATRQALPDGVYLYGQADQPDQIGSAYMVFEVQQNQVIGAFYMPYSSFDCFHGEFQAEQLALNVVDSYDRTSYPYAVALESGAPVASATGEVVAPTEIEGFQRLENLSESDRNILATCQTDLQ